METRNRYMLFVAISVIGVLMIILLAAPGPNNTQLVDPASLYEETDIGIQAYDLMDLGIADINNDNLLDIYTANHSSLQSILVNQGGGSFRDEVVRLNLSQDRHFPGLEDSMSIPDKHDAGLYIYRRNKLLYLDAYDLKPSEFIDGRIDIPWPVDIRVAPETIDVTVVSSDRYAETSIVSFILHSSEELVLVGVDDIQEMPHRISINDGFEYKRIYIGAMRLNPTSNDFSLGWRDRHSLAWADYDADGKTDVFIARGGIRGSLDRFPLEVNDELMTAKVNGFVDGIEASGIEKGNCPGRQAAWVDFDADGDLDLYLSCGRGDEPGFPNKLYRQDDNLMFTDVAVEFGVDSGSKSVFVWLDSNSDGLPDLLSVEDGGYYHYVNEGDGFSKHQLGHNARPARPYKLSIADFDNDGDLDVFAVHRKFSELLINDDGRFTIENPERYGLPVNSSSANWIDFDNDGRTDLHTLPAGIYRQRPDGLFQPTGSVALTAANDTVISSRASWFDSDNDGMLDVVIAAQTNAGLIERILGRLSGNRPDVRNRWRSSLLRYSSAKKGNWLQIELEGSGKNRQAIGAQVIVTAGSLTQLQEVGQVNGAHFGQGHYRLYFGLADHALVEKIKVSWPDGQVQVLSEVLPNQLMNIKQPDAAE